MLSAGSQLCSWTALTMSVTLKHHVITGCSVQLRCQEDGNLQPWQLKDIKGQIENLHNRSKVRPPNISAVFSYRNWAGRACRGDGECHGSGGGDGGQGTGRIRRTRREKQCQTPFPSGEDMAYEEMDGGKRTSAEE